MMKFPMEKQWKSLPMEMTVPLLKPFRNAGSPNGNGKPMEIRKNPYKSINGRMEGPI